MRYAMTVLFLVACAAPSGPGGASGTEDTLSDASIGTQSGRTGGPLLVSAFLPIAGYVGAAYQYATVVSGGTQPVSVAITGLPPGLAFDSTTGLIAGTPTTAGSFALTREVRDANGEGEVSQSTLTILSSGAYASSLLTLKGCAMPNDKERSVSAGSSAIDFGMPGTPKKCVRGTSFTHETYRDLLKQNATSPRFVFEFAGDGALAYTVLTGADAFASGTLEKSADGFVLSLSEEQLARSFATWRSRELLTVRVGNGAQSLDLIIEIAFLPAPLFVREASELVHPGFKTFAYSEESIDTIFAGAGDGPFIAAGRELRNVSGAPVVISLSADPGAFEANFERRVVAAYLKGQAEISAKKGAFYANANCPATPVYYTPPPGSPVSCNYTVGGNCALGVAAEDGFVCAPLAGDPSFDVIPTASSPYQFPGFALPIFDMGQHEEITAASENVAVVGVWNDVHTLTPAAFSDGENTALLGVDARTITVAPGQSVWLGFGIKRPTLRTMPKRDLSSSGGAHSDRMGCTAKTGIFDRKVVYPPDLSAPVKMIQRRRIEAEDHLQLSLTGNVSGEIVGAQKTLPLFGTNAHVDFDYNAAATNEIDARTFTLPIDSCP
jgi:hypothetical protein